MEKLVSRLIEVKKTIATMESCTGGGVCNEITNIEGASEILKFSAVTYSNEFKIKMGVSSSIIDKYSVYSSQCAEEMSKNISEFAGSDYGIGVTGKLNRSDINNEFGEDNVVFISIYEKETGSFCNAIEKVNLGSRAKNKKLVIDRIVSMMKDILK